MSGGERTQIAQIAIELASKIFPSFGWQRVGTSDHNFLGVPIAKTSSAEDESEDKSSDSSAKPKGTDTPPASAEPPLFVEYPADAVYKYAHPYFSITTFVHFDFKSYAEATIKPRTLNKDLQRLADTIAIADTSEDWSRKFAPEETNYEVKGALFVHNHDERGLEKFTTFFSRLTPDSIKLARGRHLYVFSPKRIIYLNSIVSDLDRLRGQGTVPRHSEGPILFFYPYGVREKPRSNLLEYASAEMLLSPLMIIRYRFENDNKKQGYIVYYDGVGAEADEFVFLFELLLKRRLLTGEDKILVRMMNAGQTCGLVFTRAKDDFIAFYHDLPAFRQLIDGIAYERIDMVRPNFSTVELGAQ